MATVRPEILDGASLSNSADGVETVRVFIVENVTGDAKTKMINAILAPGVPQLGEAHPGKPDIFVKSHSVAPIDPKTFRIEAHYKPLDWDEKEPDDTEPPEISISTTIETVTTNFDRDGKLIEVEYSGQALDAEGNYITKDFEPQTVALEVQVPVTRLRFSRKETTNSYLKNRQNKGKVNSQTWLGDPPRSWLCTDISSDFAGDGWKVSYEFQLADERRLEQGGSLIRTWDATAVFTNPATGRAVRGATIGNGILLVPYYQEADFNALLLGLP